jgi:hypothetical protein
MLYFIFVNRNENYEIIQHIITSVYSIKINKKYICYDNVCKYNWVKYYLIGFFNFNFN